MKEPEKLLNIGCGQSHIAGFINMDIVKPYDVRLDVRDGIPFQDQEVDGIYSEHFFEHLSLGEGLRFLRECRRVLKPDGCLRIAMPDLDTLIDRYVSDDWRGDGDMFEMGFEWVSTRCEMLNIGMREWGHKHLYNKEELLRVTEMAGLVSLGSFEHGKSSLPWFNGLETKKASRLIMEFHPRSGARPGKPLVTILIPAYRPTYFKEALQSAVVQTYNHFEIVICDDCPDNSILNIVEKIRAVNPNITIRYQKNERRKGNLGNFLECLSVAKGSYIKFLNDDDLLSPRCLEMMSYVLYENPQVSLVFSPRERIDTHGAKIKHTETTKPIHNANCEIEGQRLATVMLYLLTNIIGEPSTVMFRYSDVVGVCPHLAAFAGKLPVGAGDVAIWLNLLGKGNAFYFTDTLSRFRVHGEQRQRQDHIHEAAADSWIYMLKHARRLGLLQELKFWQLVVKETTESDWKRIYLLRPRLLARQVKNVVKRIVQEIKKGNSVKLFRYFKTHFLS